MKWVKANLFLLICGVVVLGSLTAWWFVFAGSMPDNLKKEMQTRAELLGRIKGLEGPVPAIVPGQPEIKGPITHGMVTEKATIQKDIKSQADQVAEEAAKYNRQGRVNDAGDPLLDGIPRKLLLPVNSDKRNSNANDFKDAYLALFNRWYAELVFGMSEAPKPPHSVGEMPVPSENSLAALGGGMGSGGSGPVTINVGSPPSSTEVEAFWAIQKASIERSSRRQTADGRTIGTPNPELTNKSIENRWKRAYISARDGQYRMYATRDMFQIRAWAFGDNAPDERQVFEAFVDVWVQQDLVAAIKKINAESSQVFTSPIKRVVRIAVGSTASAAATSSTTGTTSDFTAPTVQSGTQHGGSTGAGDIFLGVSGNAAGAVPGPGMTAMGAPPPSAGPGNRVLDYTKSMTGRVGADRFDITHFDIVVHIDPSYLIRFINEIYKQNNGYTLITMKIDAVDPFEAVSNGFIYGNQPVVRAEIIGEAMFFRDWTKALVPPVLRPLLTPPMDPLPVPGAPAAAPAAVPVLPGGGR